MANQAMTGIAFGLGMVFLATRSVRADDQAAWMKFMSDPVLQQHVLSAAGRSTVVLQNPCPEAQYSARKTFIAHAPVNFEGTGQMVSGAFRQVVDEQGCGIKRVLNVLILAGGPDDLKVMPLLPGTTHADATLQKDAVKYAVQALGTVPGGREANCQIGYVADTEFLDQENTALPGSKGPAWREIWTLASCTQSMRVPMRFIPDPTGTTISAGPSTAIQVIPLAAPHP